MSFYVTVQDAGRSRALAGPFRRHGEALAHVEPARQVALLVDDRAIWYSYGTARHRGGHALVGELNRHLNLRLMDGYAVHMGRCMSCDGYGWEKDPANRYGPELPCPACNGQRWLQC